MLKNFRFLLPVLILVITAGILLPVSPVYRQIPAVDTSVFLYVGRTIVQGGVPYKDAWDHKQPVVYLLFALAQWLTPGSLWGAWLLLLSAVGSAALLCFHALRRFSSRTLAFLSVTVGLLGLYPILWGGSIEELALPFQALAIAAWAMYRQANGKRRQVTASALMGASLAMAFLMKQNLIAAGITALVIVGGEWLFCRQWKAWLFIPAAAGGFLAVGLPVLAYLGLAGALDEYWNAAFIFNSRYAGLGLWELFIAMLDALEYMAGIPGLFLSLIIWIASLGLSFLRASAQIARFFEMRGFRTLVLAGGFGLVTLSLAMEAFGRQPGFGLVQTVLIAAGTGLLLVGAVLLHGGARSALISRLRGLSIAPDGLDLLPVLVVYFPLTLLFLTISGRNYVYYFIAFIPYLMIGFGGLGAALLASPAAPDRKTAWILLAAAWAAVAVLPAIQLASAYREPANRSLPEIAGYIEANTAPNETILAWGKPSTYVYPLTGRMAPSRHFYQAGLYEAGYNADFRVADEILSDIQARPPRLFLAYSEAVVEVIEGQCPLAAGDEPNSELRIFGFICDNYLYAGQVDNFLVFRLP